MTNKINKCDGNHGGPRCADPECWNDAPVPPAGGEVEAVIRQYRVVRPDPRDTPYSAWFEIESAEKDDQISASLRFTEGRGEPAVYEVRELVDRAHVTRLQAEVKRLDLMVSQADYNYDEDRAKFQRQAAELQAELTKLGDDYCKRVDELTKARELLLPAAHRLSDLGQTHLSEPMFTFWLATDKSAPAAKDGK